MSEQKTRNLVDSNLLPLLDSIPFYELTREILPELRQAFGARLGLVENATALRNVESSVRVFPGAEGQPDVTVVVHCPRKRTGSTGAILHIHGGGYVTGDAQSQAPIHREMAWALGCVIVSVDYRLAPETHAPGAVEDCYAALGWLNLNSELFGVDPARVGVMGESAGGGLAAALALLARDRGEHRLAFQHLIYPMLDDRTCTTTQPNPFAGEFVWTSKKNRFGWASFLGTEPGSSGVSQYAAPARALDLSGLPPTFIAVGALDLFVDENIAFAHRLIRSGVPTELHIYPGAFHGFHFDQAAEVTMKANADSNGALARALSRSVLIT
ncbi:alpha/beta hydrolase [uncultured Sphingomonas sp.]|uniref:alpha/beta hydrolase n=1 Tax=uncultured Sphingomonas sp. TaxID=158754 RepID=UPI0035CABF70